MDDLFARSDLPREERIVEGMVLLRGAATDPALPEELATIIAAAPWRNMVTPGGQTMSVAMTNCGDAGWITDRKGYRYSRVDPLTGQAWPALPPRFATLAASSADRAGFPAFRPDACLINRYDPGARLTAHQDSNERDRTQPIVSVSLGLPAVFQVYGTVRGGTPLRVELHHGDVLVFGGDARMRFHSVQPLKAGVHPTLGPVRVNLTFRKAL
jgi:alkylated DNA repair protein (DNA oxidative demethylase)